MTGRVLLIAVFVAASATTMPARLLTPIVASPNGHLALRISVGADGQLTWAATLDGKPLIEPSPLEITLDGVDLGAGAAVRAIENYRVNETYPWRGVHSTAVNRANGIRIAAQHKSGRQFTVDARAADDAVAFRFIIQGSGKRVPDAATAFRLPGGSIVWTHDLVGHYESLYERRRIEDMPPGEWAPEREIMEHLQHHHAVCANAGRAR